MRVAIIHYWLVRMRGGEAVLDALLDIFPQADVFTNVYRPGAVAELFEGRRAPRTTWIDRLPLAGRIYPLYLPLMGAALAGLDLEGYDLVVSSEAGPAKWVLPGLHARHICYAHTPMRYLWDQRHIYRRALPAPVRPGFDLLTEGLRCADVASAARVGEFVANSRFVAERIAHSYHRSSTVIHPPVRQEDAPPPRPPGEGYLFVGRLTPYKGVREAVDACVRLGRPLLVVGDGAERDYVRRFAGRGIKWTPRLGRAELLARMAGCRALLHPGVEDFGIAAVETLACGRPVVAQGRGGVRDTLEHGATAVLYKGEGADALALAMGEFERWEPRFDPLVARRAAARFAPDRFAARWRALVASEPRRSPPKAAQARLRLAERMDYSLSTS